MPEVQETLTLPCGTTITPSTITAVVMAAPTAACGVLSAHGARVIIHLVNTQILVFNTDVDETFRLATDAHRAAGQSAKS